MSARKRCVKDVEAQDRFSARHAAALISTDAHLDDKVTGDILEDFHELIERRRLEFWSGLSVPLHLTGKRK